MSKEELVIEIFGNNPSEIAVKRDKYEGHVTGFEIDGENYTIDRELFFEQGLLMFLETPDVAATALAKATGKSVKYVVPSYQHGVSRQVEGKYQLNDTGTFVGYRYFTVTKDGLVTEKKQ